MGGKEDFKSNVALIAAVLTAVIGLIAIPSFILDVLIFKNDKEQEEEIAQEKEMNLHPVFSAKNEGEISVGGENYYKIYLENINDAIDITKGTFSFLYILIVKMEETEVILSWDEVVKPVEEYDDELNGCFLLLKKDYPDCEKIAQEICENSKLKEVSFYPHVFFCIQYINASQEKAAYYLLELTGDKVEGVIEVTESERYIQIIHMPFIDKEN